MLEYIPIVPLLIATYEDLRKKEVSDTLNYLMFNISIFLLLGYLILKGIFDIKIISDYFYAFALFFSISYIFVELGIWGGGDFKLLMWLSLYLGQKRIYPLTFLFMLIFVGGIFNLTYALYLFFKKKGYKDIQHILKNNILYFVSINLLMVPLLIYNVLLFIGLILIVNLSLIIVLYSQDLFIVEKDINELVEGDWPCDKIKINEIEIPKTRKSINLKLSSILLILTILSYSLIFFQNNPTNHILAAISTTALLLSIIPKEQVYLTSEDIKLLKRLKEEGKVDKLKIKEGVPFVPAILITYIIFLYLKATNMINLVNIL